MQFNWLPVREDFDDALREVKTLPATDAARRLRELATTRLDLTQTSKLDRAFLNALKSHGSLPGLEPLRLAILGSATTSHLPPGIRVAGLRRGLAVEIYEAPYGMYYQELMSEGQTTGLRGFQPQAILLALDARHLAAADGATADSALELLQSCWRKARSTFRCQIIQQTVMPVLPALMGSNEDRMPSSPAAILSEINRRLPQLAADERVDLLALDRILLDEGLIFWHDPAIWHRSKHEVHPRAAALYGELSRASSPPRRAAPPSASCSISTTRSGAASSATTASKASCSARAARSARPSPRSSATPSALAARHHPRRLLQERRGERPRAVRAAPRDGAASANDIACFVANWTDKAANLREIAQQLNIGLDSPRVRRRQSRRTRHRPARAPDGRRARTARRTRRLRPTLAAAGYFEALRLTDDDLRARRAISGQRRARAA